MFSPIKIVCFLPLFLVLFQLVRCNCKPDTVFTTPPSCFAYECPSYTVTYSQKDYEIREYNISTWISSPKIRPGHNDSSDSYTTAAVKGFLMVYPYYNGTNKERVKINMTAPVFVNITNKGVYTVNFYVPNKYQQSGASYLPTPLSNKIKKVKLPNKLKKYAAVRRYNGFSKDGVIAKELDGLKASLNNSTWKRYLSKSSAFDEITVAGYNNPRELKDRVNELMVFFDMKE